MTVHGHTQPQGAFQLSIVRGPQLTSRVPDRELSLGEIVHYGFPARWQPAPVRDWKKRHLRTFWHGLARVCAAQVLGIPMMYSRLSFLVLRADGSVEDLLLVSVGQVVTTAGVNFIAARLANVTPANISLFNFHGIGTGATAAVIADTALGTEITTQYTPDNVRPTGTQSTPGSVNVYQTTATITVDATVAATEWGLFSQAATGGGSMLDRRVYTVVNLAASDSLVPTYSLTLPAGG